MKKYKINIMIRKGMQNTPFMDFELDNQSLNEAFQVKELSTFKDEAYVVFSLEEVPEEVCDKAYVKGGRVYNCFCRECF